MVAKGHKDDCQCVVCRNTRAKAAKMVVTITSEKEPVINPNFHPGYRVVLLDPQFDVDLPKGHIATIEAVNGDEVAITYHGKSYTVKAAELR